MLAHDKTYRQLLILIMNLYVEMNIYCFRLIFQCLLTLMLLTNGTLFLGVTK